MMRRRRAPLRLVIFDCDGVLVDSEPISNREVAAAVSALGWPMDAAEARARFLGMTLTDMLPVIEAQIGARVPDGWKDEVHARIIAALSRDVVAIPGAIEALRATTSLGIPWRIASNSSREEMAAKFARLGISDVIAGRLHSHRDVGRGKPAPDLFLAAAAAEGVAPASCVVIEDSVPGMRAARAAGMDCLAFAAETDPATALALGAAPFCHMREIKPLLELALLPAA
ncbi:MAG: HAD-IA family hydrolase [Acidisphaera sp.]|nr:HAD-IA family hydrolase [Acidisphaera sp.]